LGTKALILDEATGRNRPVVGVTGAITIDHVISDNLSDLNADFSARLREVEVEFEADGQAGPRHGAQIGDRASGDDAADGNPSES